MWRARLAGCALLLVVSVAQGDPAPVAESAGSRQLLQRQLADQSAAIDAALVTIGEKLAAAKDVRVDRLRAAYRVLRQEKGLPPSRLLVAGYLAPENKPYLERIAGELHAAGLGEEFVYRGAVDRARKIRFFHEIDVLSVPSPYHEPKGLYLLEAMACGVPVAQPSHGAFPEILERTGGGVLARSDSPADVADAIYELWKDPARAAELGRRGADGVRRHYTVTHMAEQVLGIYEEVVEKS